MEVVYIKQEPNVEESIEENDESIQTNKINDNLFGVHPNNIKVEDSEIDTENEEENCDEFADTSNDNNLDDRMSPDDSSPVKNEIENLSENKTNNIDEPIKHICDVCQTEYCDEYNLMLHKQSHPEIELLQSGKKIYTCTVCGKQCSRSSNLKVHMRMHTGEKPYLCTICNKTFTRSYSLTYHMRTHTGEKPYACSVCCKQFNHSFILSNHMRIHTGERPYECNVCKKQFNRSYSLNAHMRIHTGEKPYECPVCLKKFSDVSGRRIHMKIHNKVKCTVCIKKFSTLSDLEAHVMEKHKNIFKNEGNVEEMQVPVGNIKVEEIEMETGGEDEFEENEGSPECSSESKTDIDTLEKQEVDMNNILSTSIKHICDFCQNVFSDENSLIIHMETHTETKLLDDGKKIYMCVICSKNFNRLSHLKLHLRVHTGEKPYRCELCQKRFSRSYSLTFHMKMHKGEKPFTCSVCAKKFTQMTHLNRHKRIHETDKGDEKANDLTDAYINDNAGEDRLIKKECEDEDLDYNEEISNHFDSEDIDSPKESGMGNDIETWKNYFLEKQIEDYSTKQHICDICQTEFIDEYTLTTHKRTHTENNSILTGKKMYTCNICSKQCYRSSHLKVHMRTHTGEKPYKCKVCNKSFSRSFSLTYHMRTHTGERPFECSICNKPFNHSLTLSNHMRTHTGERPFECIVCKKHFNRSHSLTTHMRTHTGEKPYECNICRKKFSDFGSRRIHMRIHSGEKPFLCTVCNKKFTQLSHLKTHKKKIHGCEHESDKTDLNDVKFNFLEMENKEIKKECVDEDYEQNVDNYESNLEYTSSTNDLLDIKTEIQ